MLITLFVFLQTLTNWFPWDQRILHFTELRSFFHSRYFSKWIEDQVFEKSKSAQQLLGFLTTEREPFTTVPYTRGPAKKRFQIFEQNYRPLKGDYWWAPFYGMKDRKNWENVGYIQALRKPCFISLQGHILIQELRVLLRALSNYSATNLCKLFGGGTFSTHFLKGPQTLW